MNFFEYVAQEQDMSIEEAKEYITIDIFNGNVIHIGDCTGDPCVCDLCRLETLLSGYYNYIFGKNNNSRKSY